MNARPLLALPLLAALLAVACRGGTPTPAPVPVPDETTPEGEPAADVAEGEVPVEGEAEPDEEPTEGASPPPLARQQVTLYFPSAVGDGLVSERDEIFQTASPVDRAKQILSDLLSGPKGDEALHCVPPGTRLRQVYVLQDGTAYADFSHELISEMGGGSARELLAVYAIVDSLALNIPEIRRVGFLIHGRPVASLNGHLDLSRPLLPDRSLIASESARTDPAEERIAAAGPGGSPG